MPQNSGLVARGLLLLGMILILVTLVGFVVLRPRDSPAEVDAAVANRAASKPGWGVRYNATQTLALRGSTKVPLDVLAEMLDEEQQMRNFLITTPEGKHYLDEPAALKTVLDGLKVLDEWLKHKDTVSKVGAINATQLVLAAVPCDGFIIKTGVAATNAVQLQRVYAAVDKLAQNNNNVVREEAERVKKTIGSL